MRWWRMVAVGGCVLAAVGASHAWAATTAGKPSASVLEHFTPQGIVDGHWHLIEQSTRIHVNVQPTAGCFGFARGWQRQDGVRIRLLWAVCGHQELAHLRQSYAIGQAEASAYWNHQSALGANVDLVQQAPGRQIWRYWLQGNLNVAVETTCRQLSLGQCARLAVPAAKYLAARLPGKPIATPPTSLFPPASPLLGAIGTMALIFVGARRLSARSKLEKFEISTGDPRIHRVDVIAGRLRKVNRRRWWGKFLAVVTVMAAVSAVAGLVDGSIALLAGEAVLAVVCGTASRALLRSDRDQARSADIPYALYLGRRMTGGAGSSWPSLHRRKGKDTAIGGIRRLAGWGFILLLGMLAIGAPTLVLLGWLIAGLTGSAQNLSSVLAVVVLAAVAVGYFIDRGAQRLIARQVQDAMRHDQRPYFLYLRNFGDDAQKIMTSRLSRRGIWQRSTAWLNPVGSARFEEVLTQALAHSGPIIAVSPRDTKLRTLVSAVAPSLGAAKTILPDNGWQDLGARIGNETGAAGPDIRKQMPGGSRVGDASKNRPGITDSPRN